MEKPLKTFFKTLLKFAGPILLIAVVIFLYIDLKTIRVDEMIGKMIEANAAGTLTGEEYINDAVGISFDTPEVEDIPWHIIPYNQQFTSQPTLFSASKAEFVCMEKDSYWTYFILRIRYQDIPNSRYKKESSEEFAKRMRDDYLRETSSRYLSEYWDRFIISDSMPVIIGGNTYYKYSSHDIELNDYYTSYIIVQNGFGYRFFFYGWGEPIDQNYVDSILFSIKFAEPEIEFETK